MSDYPREPDAYSWSVHLQQDALESSGRFLTEELIEQAVQEGRDCVRSVNEPIRRKLNIDGIDIVIVLTDENGELEIISGWTEVNSIVTALSDESRWSSDEVQIIQESDRRNQASEGDPQETSHP